MGCIECGFGNALCLFVIFDQLSIAPKWLMIFVDFCHIQWVTMASFCHVIIQSLIALLNRMEHFFFFCQKKRPFPKYFNEWCRNYRKIPNTISKLHATIYQIVSSLFFWVPSDLGNISSVKFELVRWKVIFY